MVGHDFSELTDEEDKLSTVSVGDTDVAESWDDGPRDTVSTLVVVCCKKIVIVSGPTI